MLINVTIRGVKPLLMNSPNSIGDVTNGKKKSIYIPEDEAEKVTYRDEQGMLCIPALNILAAMKNGAVNFKAPGKGQKTLKSFVYSGLQIPGDEMLPILPQEYIIDTRSVVIGRARVLKWRPKIKDWSCSFQIEIVDESVWDPSTVRSVLEEAGKFIGLLDFRPLFGTFSIESMTTEDGKQVR